MLVYFSDRKKQNVIGRLAVQLSVKYWSMWLNNSNYTNSYNILFYEFWDIIIEIECYQKNLKFFFSKLPNFWVLKQKQILSLGFQKNSYVFRYYDILYKSILYFLNRSDNAICVIQTCIHKRTRRQNLFCGFLKGSKLLVRRKCIIKIV